MTFDIQWLLTSEKLADKADETKLLVLPRFLHTSSKKTDCCVQICLFSFSLSTPICRTLCHFSSRYFCFLLFLPFALDLPSTENHLDPCQFYGSGSFQKAASLQSPSIYYLVKVKPLAKVRQQCNPVISAAFSHDIFCPSLQSLCLYSILKRISM